ncbi:MAG: hypothetical protein J4203_01630 [Candidatus Diapherotrites archaeon]|uniref:DUF4258 domain-containing protein n=1 Tax=Candidatus Iainarchaeum sp. TaxID=3101447 RepID=A0A8T4LAF6_9ARCH|nr:hypothetical protein [Candidatus Diapherotrites archaeon]
MYYERIVLTSHARKRLHRIGFANVFELVKHGKIIRRPKKDGEPGTLQVSGSKRTVLMEFVLWKNELIIKTVKTKG